MTFKVAGFMFSSSCAACVDLVLASSTSLFLFRRVALLSSYSAQFIAQSFDACLRSSSFFCSSAAGGAQSGLLQSGHCCDAVPMATNCPMIPCPFCFLSVGHDANGSDIAQAVQRYVEPQAGRRLTQFQLGMIRNAAAEALHSSGLVSSPVAALNLAARMESEPFISICARPPAPSTAPRAPPLPPSTPYGPARTTSGQLHQTSSARSSGWSSSAAAAQHELPASILRPPPPLPVQSDTRAASASAAWLAPESSSSAADGGYVLAQSSNMEVALPPDGPLEAPTPAMETSTDQEEHVWQVHAGRPGRRFWKTVDEDLARTLEEAEQNGRASCQWVYEGWAYTYNMVTMVQTSETTGAERPIRRVPYQQAHSDRADENLD